MCWRTPPRNPGPPAFRTLTELGGLAKSRVATMVSSVVSPGSVDKENSMSLSGANVSSPNTPTKRARGASTDEGNYAPMAGRGSDETQVSSGSEQVVETTPPITSNARMNIPSAAEVSEL